MIAGTAVNRILAALLSWILVLSPFPIGDYSEARDFAAGNIACRVYESERDGGVFGFYQRVYDFSDAMVIMLRAEGASEKESEAFAGVCFYELSLADASKAHLRYKDEDGSWTAHPIEEGLIRCENLSVETEGRRLFVNLPQSYEDLGSGAVRCLKELEGAVKISLNEAGGADIRVLGACSSRGFSDALVMIMDGASPDWAADNSVTVWDRYISDGTARWLFDGYYRNVPEAYEPSCEGGYYLCAASYIVRLMAELCGSCPMAPYLCLACWDTVMKNQSEEGCWLTGPRSLWLSESFGIDPGFYDTRFNADLMQTGLLINEKLGGLSSIENVRRFAEFYKANAESNHTETENGGWLVADYSGPGQSAPVHTSLNHQAAECLALYGLGELLGDEECSLLADKLLQAIYDTSEGWVRADHDLWYSLSAGGEYSGSDYVSLTYGDLTALRDKLISMGRTPSEKLLSLISEKALWLDSKGIDHD
ncbi:MAG: hypothetical protein IJM17_06430 [Firmicutes bacterium]|nr:hypothetical protein [Bacillota bacterium]